MKRISAKLSYANVMATVAVFLALGGAAYAATKLPKNSVGTNQIKKGAVTGIKIKKGTITGTNIDLAKLGTVPSASTAASANTATTAGTANALSALEPTRLVGAPGQPPFLDGASDAGTTAGINFQQVGFYKDHDGTVHLHGVAKIGKGESPVKGLLFQLPPGYRPTSGVAETFTGFGENTLIVVFGSNTTLEGKNLEGDVLDTGEDEEAAILGGITFRAES